MRLYGKQLLNRRKNLQSLSFALLTFAVRERRGPRLLLLAERKHAIPLALLKFEN